jgi:hypothetical protein
MPPIFYHIFYFLLYFFINTPYFFSLTSFILLFIRLTNKISNLSIRHNMPFGFAKRDPNAQQ